MCHMMMRRIHVSQLCTQNNLRPVDSAGDDGLRRREYADEDLSLRAAMCVCVCVCVCVVRI